MVLSQMPAGQDKRDLINYLEQYFKNYDVIQGRNLYRRLIKSSVHALNAKGWPLANALNDAFQWVSFKVVFVRAWQLGQISVANVLDWVAGNVNSPLAMGLVDFIETSHLRVAAMKTHLITSVVDVLKLDPGFNPPYTNGYEQVFSMMYY